MPFVAIDVETTGLDPVRDRVIEVAAVRFDRAGRILGCLETFLHPGESLTVMDGAVHGITEDVLRLAPAIDVALPRLLEFLPTSHQEPYLAHNACIDAAFLGAEFHRTGLSIPSRHLVDTLALARRVRPEFRHHGLGALARQLALQQRPVHRALADALCVAQLWIALGGPDIPTEALLAYPLHDPTLGVPPPRGWEKLAEAIVRGRSVRLEHEGSRRGLRSRVVTPRGSFRRVASLTFERSATSPPGRRRFAWTESEVMSRASESLADGPC